MADYQQAIELHADNAQAHYNIAWLLHRRGQNEEAIAHYERALALRPQFALAINSRGISWAELGKEDLALKDFDKANELAPYSPYSYYERGRLMARRGDLEKAVSDFSSALVFGQRPTYYQSRGAALEKLGRRREAALDYLSALRAAGVRDSISDTKSKDEADVALRRLLDVGPVPPPTATKRVALVIGNSNYKSLQPLRNPANDARAVKARLERLNFTVFDAFDLSHGDFLAKLRDFGDAAESADWALLYYAGHGTEFDGNNYLVPVDASLKHIDAIEDELVKLSSVLAKVGRAKELGIVILDACRDSSYLDRLRRQGRSIGYSGGLAAPQIDRNTIVLYAAEAGTIARDGTDENSPFTQALLTVMETTEQGEDVDFAFRKVRDTVLMKTNGFQRPYVYHSLPARRFQLRVAQ